MQSTFFKENITKILMMAKHLNQKLIHCTLPSNSKFTRSLFYVSVLTERNIDKDLCTFLKEKKEEI